MTTIHISRNPEQDCPFIPVFPPMETVWNPTKQAASWKEALTLTEFVTWSEPLINVIGAAIDEKLVDCKDIKVVLHLDDDETRQNNTDTLECYYDEDGILKSPWIFGFMYPHYEFPR